MFKVLLPIMSTLLLMKMPAQRLFLITGIIPMALTPATFLTYPLLHSSVATLWGHSDSLSVPLIVLTLWVFSLAMVASQKILICSLNTKKFCVLTALLSVFLMMSFYTHHLMSFYIMFEASLLITLFIILGWGKQPERLQASTYLVLYTVTASLPLLWAILSSHSWGSHILMMPSPPPLMDLPLIKVWWVLLMAAFFVKTPIYTTHLWLPKAHVEAPVAGSMVLAALMLKLGGYGVIRLSSMFSPLNLSIKPILMATTLVGACATSLICLRQTDIKALIAYSSVGHMGFMTAAILTNSQWAWQGALLTMVAHGLTSSGLFAMSNSIYEVYMTRSLFLTKGILSLFPPITMLFFLLVATNMAAPPSINFLGELCLLPPIIATSTPLILPLAVVMFLSAAYSLSLFTAANHGQPLKSTNPLSLLNSRNMVISILHLAPSISLIAKPDFISPWL